MNAEQAEQLRRLESLLDDGVLTPDEYAAKRAAVIGNPSSVVPVAEVSDSTGRRRRRIGLLPALVVGLAVTAVLVGGGYFVSKGVGSESKPGSVKADLKSYAGDVSSVNADFNDMTEDRGDAIESGDFASAPTLSDAERLLERAQAIEPSTGEVRDTHELFIETMESHVAYVEQMEDSIDSGEVSPGLASQGKELAADYADWSDSLKELADKHDVDIADFAS